MNGNKTTRPFILRLQLLNVPEKSLYVAIEEVYKLLIANCNIIMTSQSSSPKIAIKSGKQSHNQGWQYGTVRSEFAYYVPLTLKRTVPAYRTSVQFLKRTVPVPLQKRRH